MDLGPSNSPDLNPLEYYFWVQIEVREGERYHNGVVALNEDNKKAVRSPEMAWLPSLPSMWKTSLWPKMAMFSRP